MPRQCLMLRMNLMNNNWSERSTIILFVLITVFGFLIWVSGLCLFWFIVQNLGFSTNLWAMIEALSTAVAAAAVLSAGYIAYRELSEIANSRFMEVADRLFTELNLPENIEARRWIFLNLPDDPQQGLDTLTSEGQTAIKRVLNSLDRVAFLTQNNWITDDVIMPWMHPMIAKSWEKLEPYVLYERVRRNEPYYYEHAGILAKRCRRWRENHLSDFNIRWIDDAL